MFMITQEDHSSHVTLVEIQTSRARIMQTHLVPRNNTVIAFQDNARRLGVVAMVAAGAGWLRHSYQPRVHRCWILLYSSPYLPTATLIPYSHKLKLA
jgi:hypothetical protein